MGGVSETAPPQGPTAGPLPLGHLFSPETDAPGRQRVVGNAQGTRLPDHAIYGTGCDPMIWENRLASSSEVVGLSTSVSSII